MLTYKGSYATHASGCSSHIGRRAGVGGREVGRITIGHTIGYAVAAGVALLVRPRLKLPAQAIFLPIKRIALSSIVSL